jgi:hypothetical protein
LFLISIIKVIHFFFTLLLYLLYGLLLLLYGKKIGGLSQKNSCFGKKIMTLPAETARPD